MGQARLREALNAGGPSTQKEKGPPVADGILTVTPDTAEALEWKSRRSAIDSAGTSSSYLEDDEEPQPHGLYGKFTWKIENFSEISKRELRSTVFEVGSYKWYILVYPQGCDVCNHLSLFLCVADYDKLLPGWSHFAQFTIAVVNKDPKKSKYSDTLHRFCKKEHDWGWKKFMELSKVLEGFTVANTLVIKAQVQVIRDRPSLPFRCLDPQYRRELVRVYLTNVEGICRRFVDEKRESLLRMKETTASFKAYWASQTANDKKALVQHKGSDMLKGLVKRFFNEKEVTSTLVMDALFSGCKQVEEASRAGIGPKGKRRVLSPPVVINADKNMYALGQDVLAVLDNACQETVPMLRDEKASDALTVRHGPETDDYNRDFIERDERRLADLGRKTVEMYVIAHIIADLEEHHVKFEKYKMQDALIQEEEEGQRMDKNKAAAKAASEREKKQRKKEKRQARVEAESARREAEEAERSRAEELKRQETERVQSEQVSERRQVQEALKKAQAQAVEEAAACSTAPAELTVGKAMEASKEAAAQLAAQGISQQAGPDPADGPSSSTSTAPKDDRGAAAGGSGRQPADPCFSGSSSLTDLPLEEECSGTSRRLTVDSEEDGFSFNEDETESQEEVIQSLHLHIDSLKNQVGSLLDEAEAKERLVSAINQQLDMRDKRIRDLTKQLQEAAGQLAEASTALEARSVLLKEKEQELADKDAELSSVRLGCQQTPQQQLPQQQQLQQKQHRDGSVASTSRSTVGLPFEESSARSSASSDSHPLSPTSSMDTPTDPSLHLCHNPLNPNHRPQSHSLHHPAHSVQAHTLSRDSSSGTSHSQRTDRLCEKGGEKAGLEPASTHESSSHVTDDRGSGTGPERHAGTAGLKAGSVVGTCGTDQSHQSCVQSKTGGRPGTGPQPQQPSPPPPNAASASGKPDSLSAATAAAAAALRPVKHGNGRSQSSSIATGPGKGLVAGHSQALLGHPHTTSGPHAGMPNGVSTKPSQQQQQQSAKQANARTLNGNAAAFVPASVSGGMPSISSSLSLTSPGSGTLNGHSGHASHTSYRNAAAGMSTPASSALATTSMALPSGADKGSSSQGSLSPRQSISSGLHMTEAAAPCSPGPVSRGMQNGDGIYPSRGHPQQSHTMPFTSPDGSKGPGHGPMADSSGLEGFAHMGLINDLLA
ncbi:hypothetical protein WJX77_011749 [Trebouxia sp. C0004]